MFALINLNIQRRFNSGHALALYENCYRFARTGSTGWWPLEIFRRLMGVDGSAYYETFKHLNAKVIKPAVTEVNKTSNIFVTPELRKSGRTVSAIRFRIKENPQLAMFDIDDGEAVRSGEVYRRLRDLGVSDRLARQWIGEHGEAYVGDKIDYVAAKPDVSSPARYLAAAIRDDYAGAGTGAGAAPDADPAVRAEMERRQAGEQALRAAEDARAEALNAERRRRAARMARVREIVEARNPTQRDADRRFFLSSLKGDLEREEFARLGWASALNARAIFAFWQEVQPGAFADLPEWVCAPGSLAAA